jgi:rhomboid protease GluP
MDDPGTRGTIERTPGACPTTAVVLGITTLVTLAQFAFPQVLEALRRTPDALAHGEWWRLVSPLFVHAYGWPHLLVNFAWIGAVGVAVERRFGHARWLLFYFVPGVLGECFGLLWEPHGAGASLGGSGLLGAFAAWLLVHGQRKRGWGILVLACGALLTWVHDIHGPPTLAGAALGSLALLRSRRSSAPRQE